MIRPDDVITSASVEDLCRTAETYYATVPDPAPLMSKPFSFLHETPEALQNLGVLLGGLRLGKSMTVLDFGAGTCWLSRFLIQLSCKAISCDPSPTALQIGKRLFDRHPPIGRAVYAPRFLLFDGHRIDLPDESVDRIVCFDAFHHVPNQAEVLGEFSRVLRSGGIAGFSEPGAHHSETPQSQYEMKNYAVLENDIIVGEIFRLAQRVGFTDLSVAVVTDNMEMSLAQHEVLFSTGSERDAPRDVLRSEIWNQVHNGMFNRSIFFLRKGAHRPDSRSHVGLAHALDAVASGSRRGQRSIELTVTARNVGTAHWLNENDEIFGIVRVGTHLYDREGALIAVDHSRHSLPRAVSPGERVSFRVEVPLPDERPYRLGIDLVAEGVIWFENAGSKPVLIEVARAGDTSQR